MKLSFSTLGCPEWSLRQIADAAASYGYQGVDFRGLQAEVDITRLPEFGQNLDQTLAMFRERGIELPCFNTSVTLVTPIAQRWQEMLDECQRYAALAQRTRTQSIRVFGGRAPADLPRPEAVMLARRHLRQVARICASHGCRVLLETHDEWNRADAVNELLEGISAAEAGVLWDIEHTFRAGEAPEVTAAGLRDRICHTHFKDSAPGQGRNDPRLIGEGNIPIAQFVGALKSIGYDGWLCLESEKRWHADSPDPEVIFPQYTAYMKSLIQ
jgi:sugar phosphate isomerase/epimerase